MPTLELSLKPDAVVNPWSPWAIPNLSGFFHFTEGNCYVSNGGAATAVDGVVGYVPSLFGGTLTASEATNKPVLKSDGLQFATTSDVLNLSSSFVAGAATIYAVLTCPAANNLIFLCKSDDSAYLASTAGLFGAQNDGNSTGPTCLVPDSTLALLRFEQVSSAGDVRVDATSDVAGGASTASNFGPFTFNAIGYSSLVAGSDAPTRLRLLILINRHIAYDSPEDVRIRNWIAANDGATL